MNANANANVNVNVNADGNGEEGDSDAAKMVEGVNVAEDPEDAEKECLDSES